MKTKVSIPFVLLFCLFVGQVQAAETPPVVETFACNLLPGKDMGDVESATRYWNEQIDKIDNEDLNTYSAWMVTPIRTTLTADWWWLGASPNANAWGRGLDAYYASSEGQSADERFSRTAECTSQVWTSEPLYGEGPTDGSAVLEVFGCSLKKGKTMANVRAVEANFTKQAEALGLEMNVFRFNPVYGNGETDLLYLVGHENMSALAANNTKVRTTPAAATANFFFGLVMDCGAGVYNVDTIRFSGPPE